MQGIHAQTDQKQQDTQKKQMSQRKENKCLL